MAETKIAQTSSCPLMAAESPSQATALSTHNLAIQGSDREQLIVEFRDIASERNRIFEDQAVNDSVVANVGSPNRISQGVGSIAHCAPTVLGHLLAGSQPHEYERLVTDLNDDGSAVTTSGVRIAVNLDVIPEAIAAGQDPGTALLNSTLDQHTPGMSGGDFELGLENISGEPVKPHRSRNAAALFINHDTEKKAAHQAGLFGAIREAATLNARKRALDGVLKEMVPDKIEETTLENLLKSGPVPASISAPWGADFLGPNSSANMLHQIVVHRVENGLIYYFDPDHQSIAAAQQDGSPILKKYGIVFHPKENLCSIPAGKFNDIVIFLFEQGQGEIGTRLPAGQK